MSTKSITVGLAVAAIGIIILFLFGTPDPNPLKTAAATPQPASTPKPSYASNFESTASPASKTSQQTKTSAVSDAASAETSQPPASAEDAQRNKEQTLEKIQEAMNTFSEEGLPVLKPYLSHPDPEIRAASVEAIKQLAVPAGAEVLRRAAKAARSTGEQIEMLQAAEFLELPRVPLDEFRRMIETGTLQLPPPEGTSQPVETPAGN